MDFTTARQDFMYSKEQIKKWDFYLDNPMEGSERWKELHADD